jgi:hypothetical protein
VHGAAWLLCPSAPSVQASAQEDASAVWMTAASDTAAPSQAPEPAAQPVASTTPATRHATHARVTRLRHDERLAQATSGVAEATSFTQQAVDTLAATMQPGAPSQPAASGAAGDGTTRSNTGGSVSGSGAAVRGPGLLTLPSPCRGFFPAAAQVDRGAVQISVHVDETGRARLHRLLMEMPRDQGFAAAAHACTKALRFAPAINSQGIAVAGEAKLELTFHRS